MDHQHFVSSVRIVRSHRQNPSKHLKVDSMQKKASTLIHNEKLIIILYQKFDKNVKTEFS